jgi:translation initiation factor 5B
VREMQKIRAPIVVTVGHSDHGKTTLLDKIRGTTVTALEPGLLTQAVGATNIPIETIKKICDKLLKKFGIKLSIPGLLFIDTPGHKAFLSMRKRGGSISDLAILVVDVNEGFQEQTDESLTILKQFKVPFVVAATKIDKIPGWYAFQNASFLDSIQKQREDVKEELEKKIYRIVSQLAERGFDAERFDRIRDFRKNVAIVPVSGITGEGIPDLLMVLAGLAQQFLKEKLYLSEQARGSILEVKETKGFGTTIDIILYDGSLEKNDFLIIGGKEPIVTRIRALLLPPPLKELRVEKKFLQVDKVFASVGVKIAAPGLENAIAGSPIIGVKSESEIEKAKEVLKKEVEEIQFTKQIEGVIAKADTLGGLEALIKILSEKQIPVRKAEVGVIKKEDIVEIQNVKDRIRRVILAFNVKATSEAENLAKDLKIPIFFSEIIYRLVENYEKWCLEEREKEVKEKLEKVTRPCEIEFLKGYVFRQHSPAIFGIEVKRGFLKPGITMKRKDGKIVGKIKEIQREGQTIHEARKGDRVAISMEEPVIGRHIHEGDILISVLSEDDIKILKEVYDKLSDDEKELLSELGI